MEATTTHRPVNLASIAWTDNGRRAMFSASRPGFGVEEVATGRLLSSDGIRPSVWSTKAIATTIAQYPPAWSTIEVVA